MGVRSALIAIGRFFSQNHGPAKSFEVEVEGAGIAGRVDGGMKTIPAAKIVGSVGRAQNLRSDFFYRTGRAMTARFVSIGKAMEEGKVLPPIEVYKAKLRRAHDGREIERTEYYVVDGHHRVAMAKKLGQDYLDAHVVEYRVAARRPAEGPVTIGAEGAGAAAPGAGAGTPTAPAAPPPPGASTVGRDTA
jgi:hypothetical protein